MRRLGHRTLAAVREFVGGLDDATDVDALAARVIRELRRVVPATIVTLNEFAPATRSVLGMWADARDFAGVSWPRDHFVSLMDEHPLLQHFARTADAGPRAISDLMTWRRFEATAIYAEYYRLLGTRDQMVVRLPAKPGTVVGVALSRARRDFSAEDRLALEVIRPHLAAAYRAADAVARARTALELAGRAAETTAHAFVLLGRDGALEFVTPAAGAWLDEFFGAGRPATRLPPAIADWLRGSRTSAAGGAPRTAYVVERDGVQLAVRAVAERGQMLLWLARRRTSVDPRSLERLGLTDREAEVLAWVADGKSNHDVASITGTSPRTVAKHLQRIYEKLGVESRTAAAARVRSVS